MAVIPRRVRKSPAVGRQLSFTPILVGSKEAEWRALTDYAVRNRALYLTYARAITPDLRDWRQIWDRLAFAILTANALIDDAVRAFHQVRDRRGGGIGIHGVAGMTPDKARSLNELPAGRATLRLRKRADEGWLRYRARLATVRGLAFTKASYAACLLYPLEAEVACLDTWMQKLLLGVERFEWLTIEEYIETERQLARWARVIGVNLALAQWIAWDWTRGDGPTAQRFFN